MISRLFAPCGRRTLATRPSNSFTPAASSSTDASLRWARGCTTAGARSTGTCRSSSFWAGRPAISAAATRSHPGELSRTRARWRTHRSGSRACRALPAPRTEPVPPTQQAEFELVDRLNRLAAVEYPSDRVAGSDQIVRAGLSDAVCLPRNLANLENETKQTRRLYGLDNPVTAPFGRQCLVVRAVERGVRFIQLYHGVAPPTMTMVYGIRTRN